MPTSSFNYTGYCPTQHQEKHFKPWWATTSSGSPDTDDHAHKFHINSISTQSYNKNNRKIFHTIIQSTRQLSSHPHQPPSLHFTVTTSTFLKPQHHVASIHHRIPHIQLYTHSSHNDNCPRHFDQLSQQSTTATHIPLLRTSHPMPPAAGYYCQHCTDYDSTPPNCATSLTTHHNRIQPTEFSLLLDSPVKTPNTTLASILDSVNTGNSFDEHMWQQQRFFLATLADLRQNLVLAQQAFETQPQSFLAHHNAMQHPNHYTLPQTV